MTFVDKVTTETYKFLFLIGKELELALSLLTPAVAKTQFFVHLILFPLSHCDDCQKLLRYCNGTAVFAFLKIPSALFVNGFPDILLYNCKT